MYLMCYCNEIWTTTRGNIPVPCQSGSVWYWISYCLSWGVQPGPLLPPLPPFLHLHPSPGLLLTADTWASAFPISSSHSSRWQSLLTMSWIWFALGQPADQSSSFSSIPTCHVSAIPALQAFGVKLLHGTSTFYHFIMKMDVNSIVSSGGVSQP